MVEKNGDLHLLLKALPAWVAKAKAGLMMLNWQTNPMCTPTAITYTEHSLLDCVHLTTQFSASE